MSVAVPEASAHCEPTAASLLKGTFRGERRRPEVLPTARVQKKKNHEIKERLLVGLEGHTEPESCRPNKSLGLCFM